MLGQARDVAGERMTWESLSEQDKALDQYIGVQLANFLEAAICERLQGTCPHSP